MMIVNTVRGRQYGGPRRTVHRPSCPWAGLGRWSYEITLAEANRLARRAERGDDDGHTRLCDHCVPGVVIAYVNEGT